MSLHNSILPHTVVYAQEGPRQGGAVSSIVILIISYYLHAIFIILATLKAFLLSV